MFWRRCSAGYRSQVNTGTCWPDLRRKAEGVRPGISKSRVAEPPCFGGSGSFLTRAAPAPAPLKFAMVSAKMMIPVQTGISGIFSNTIKCKLNLKTGTRYRYSQV